MMESTDKLIDKLDRYDFVQFVKDLIINSEQYRRNTGAKSYVAALDSAWGTGKSYFIDLLMQDIEEQNNIRVIKYNAWENDYCDNAFNPLIYDILKSECLSFSTETDADIENIGKMVKSILKIGAAFTKQLTVDAIKEKMGVDVEKALQEALSAGKTVKDFMLREIPNIEILNEQREAFEEFKNYLSNATTWLKESDIKLVVIIDELDRCKPTFAIQTLEVVKHLFDIENIVFLFAVDIEQLSHSVSSVYGQGFDSVGYLCRFFDYIAKMPIPNINVYVQDQINSMGLIGDIDVPDVSEAYKTRKLAELVSEFIVETYRSFDFSLRDLDTLLQSYKIMLNNFLGDYKMLGAHMIYIFYLALKYKKPDMFYKTFLDTASYKSFIQSDLAPFIRRKYQSNKWLQATSDVMYVDKPLCDVDLLPYFDGRGNNDGSITKYIRLETYENGKIVALVKVNVSGRMINERLELENRSNNSMGNILFDQDILKWEDIKKMTYREYLHKQLENYNFVSTKEQA